MRTRSGIDTDIEKIEDWLDSIENKHVDLEKQVTQLEANLEVSRDEKRELEKKDVTKGVKMLGQNTVDYIEAHYGDIIVEEMLSGTFDDKEYTCQADTVQVDPGLDPRNKAQIEAKKEEDPEEEL